MSVLVASKDFYLSTQQSGSPGTTDQTFSKFRMCLNSNPLICSVGEQTRLSLTQFSAYRNWYHVNQHNNRFDIFYTDAANNLQSGSFQLKCQDYADIDDIAIEFRLRLQNKLRAMTGNNAITVTAPNNNTMGFGNGATGDRIFAADISIPTKITKQTRAASYPNLQYVSKHPRETNYPQIYI